MQVQTVPLVAMVLQGRLPPMFQDAPPLEELRMMLTSSWSRWPRRG